MLLLSAERISWQRYDEPIVHQKGIVVVRRWFGVLRVQGRLRKALHRS